MKEIRYFFVPNAASVNILPPDEAIHALRVLRLTEGDQIYLMDGNGHFFQAEVTQTSSKKCLYRIIDEYPQKPIWRGKIHLVIAPTKDVGRIEWMVEKATEVGFDTITFLDCKFSERKKIRTDRIEKIVISAVKQSRKGWKPIVNEMISFDKFISEYQTEGLKYICHCYDEIDKADFFNTDKTHLQTIHKKNNALHAVEDITILVGPEGDFSIDEVKTALSKGYESVSLGKSRLRTETAGLTAVMMAELNRRV